jgi:hypothetical protein
MAMQLVTNQFGHQYPGQLIAALGDLQYHFPMALEPSANSYNVGVLEYRQPVDP